MKSKALIAVAVAGAFWSVGSVANQTVPSGIDPISVHSAGPSGVSEAPPAMSTLTSLDTRTGGYKGWGPMANPKVASSSNESMPLEAIDQERAYQQHLAEVRSVREQVWVANAPLRSEYENIGASRSEGGRGFGRFFGR